ncbi:MAG: cytochrome c3 family protein [Thermodesulfobacteriota bacterium]
MGSQKEIKVAYGLAVVLLVVGIVCYAAGSPEKPDEPVRKVYKNLGGDVVFDHTTHTQYADDCTVCHHHNETENFTACAQCHGTQEAKTVPAVCADCHPLSGDKYPSDDHHAFLETEPDTWTCKRCHSLAEGETVPASCGECHEPDLGEAKIMKFQKSSDAMHDQCIGCHKDMGGPVECGECHAQ